MIEKIGGLNYETALNGAEAVEKVLSSDKQVDLILMDCNMPIMDGFEVNQE